MPSPNHLHKIGTNPKCRRHSCSTSVQRNASGPQSALPRFELLPSTHPHRGAQLWVGQVHGWGGYGWGDPPTMDSKTTGIHVLLTSLDVMYAPPPIMATA